MKQNIFIIIFSILITVTQLVQANEICDLNHFNNTFMTIGNRYWFVNIDPTLNTNNTAHERPCEYNLRVNHNDPNDNENYAYYVGVLEDISTFMQFKFTLHSFSDILANFQSDQRLTFFKARKETVRGQNNILSMVITQFDSENWQIDLNGVMSHSSLTSSTDSLIIPKNLQDPCNCLPVIVTVDTVSLPIGIRRQMHVSIGNENFTYILPYKDMPNLTELGFIDADLPLAHDNWLYLKNISVNTTLDAAQ